MASKLDIENPSGIGVDSPRWVMASLPTELTAFIQTRPMTRRKNMTCRLVRHCITAALVATASPLIWAQVSHHLLVESDKLNWVAVPSLPMGAQIAVIEGPMNDAVPFTVRLRFPANYRIPPHWHPAVERVTVLSGTFNMGSGDHFDDTKTHALNPGGVAIMPAKSPHYAWTAGDTVVQLHGTGPWGITYIDPADDPRKK